jgi:hypothetical protein
MGQSRIDAAPCRIRQLFMKSFRLPRWDTIPPSSTALLRENYETHFAPESALEILRGSRVNPVLLPLRICNLGLDFQ